uniref:Uncharacterized protein n=1 Tax=Vitis vinifera TaxID=29760 RepID=F6GUH7_VITVI
MGINPIPHYDINTEDYLNTFWRKETTWHDSTQIAIVRMHPTAEKLSQWKEKGEKSESQQPPL